MKGLLSLAFLAALGNAAVAADLPLKSNPLLAGYPTGCGFYYGAGTAGSAGAVNGAVVGTQIVQGELNALIGYTCPFAAQAFWFIEGSVGMTNVNGSVNGLALSGPVVLRERLGAGSPINSVFNPFGTSLSMPSLPLLPAGVTANPSAQPYFFVGLEEQDMTPQLGGLAGSSKVWAISGMVGMGMLTRLSNNVVVDTWAAFEPRSQTFCPGNGIACASLGNRGVVGASFKY